MSNSSERKQPYLSIMGSIGAGKTTAAKLIRDHRNFSFLPEKFADNPYMEDYYKNPEMYAFRSQLFFFISKALRHKKELPAMFKDPNTDGVVDDSPLAQDGAYAYMHRDSGNINDRDWMTYKLAFHHRRTMILPNLVIFLPTDVEIALERIKNRGRPYEQDIKPEYLTSLNTSLLYAFEKLPEMGVSIAKFPTNEVNLVDNQADIEKFLAFVDEQIANLKTETFHTFK